MTTQKTNVIPHSGKKPRKESNASLDQLLAEIAAAGGMDAAIECLPRQTSVFEKSADGKVIVTVTPLTAPVMVPYLPSP
jgi:hypothetical protein